MEQQQPTCESFVRLSVIGQYATDNLKNGPCFAIEFGSNDLIKIAVEDDDGTHEALPKNGADIIGMLRQWCRYAYAMQKFENNEYTFYLDRTLEFNIQCEKHREDRNIVLTVELVSQPNKSTRNAHVYIELDFHDGGETPKAYIPFLKFTAFANTIIGQYEEIEMNTNSSQPPSPAAP